jgi:phytoene dehydrogenase-like protein
MSLVPGDPRRWGVDPASIVSWTYKNDERYRRVKLALEEACISRFERLFPQTKELIAFRESATPISHTRYTRAAGGTGYGLAAIPRQFLYDRPSYRGPLRNLYLCGASARAGHGVVGTMTSGHQVAWRLANDLGRPLGITLTRG